jgi:predicted alpha/beta-fold hydrolase
MLASLSKRGWRAVLMHFRGCSGTHNRMVRGYHSGDTGDLRHVIEILHTRYPGTRIAAAGFSLGGNVLLKYLGETGVDSGLAAAAAISVPFVLSRSADRLDRGFSRIYQYHLLRHLRKRITDKFKNRQDAPFAISQLCQWNNFHLFDNFVTAPLHGFSGSSEYYRLSSCRPYLKSIKTPTLIVHAKNDPFVFQDAIPDAAELPDSVELELPRAGGHAGFVTGKFPWRPHYWLEQRLPEFFSGYLN